MYSGKLLAFVCYFALLLGVGVLSRRKVKNDADFVVGSRSINYWLTALSAHSSDMSAWLFMGLPGAIYTFGFPKVWIVIGLILGMLANWLYVAPGLRRLTESYDSYTLSTFFERRFNDRSGLIRLITGGLALLFLTAYLTSGVVAMGRMMESLFEIPYSFAILTVMPVLIFYVFFGGYVTVVWIDCFQAIFLILVALFVPFYTFQKVGGWNALAEAALTRNTSLSLFPSGSFSLTASSLLLGLGWGLGYFGQPHIITKFMGISSPKELKKSMYLGMSWQIVALSSAVFIGLIAIAYFPQGVENHEMVFIEMVKGLFSPFIASFVLCAVIAANMSTMDSQVLVAGSILSEDLLLKTSSGLAQPEKLLKFSRLGVVLIPSLATFLALFRNEDYILDIVGYAWSGLGATFGPIVLASLYSKSANTYGVIGGAVTGGVIAATWPLFGHYVVPFPVLSIIPAFFSSCLVIAVLSKVSKPC